MKWKRRVAKAAAKTTADRLAAAAWRAISDKVCKRDGGRCQLCGMKTIPPGSGNPELFGGAHHIIWRSAGGPDELWNLVWTDAKCHAAVHDHAITVGGTADALTIT